MKIAIIDGNSLCKTRFEANYANADKNGHEVTQANYIKGFTSFLYKDVLNRFPGFCFDGIVLVFDAEGENLRNKIYPEYKANRKIDAKYSFFELLTLEKLQADGVESVLKEYGVKVKNVNPVVYESLIDAHIEGKNDDAFISSFNELLTELNANIQVQRDEFVLKSDLFKKTLKEFKELLTKCNVPYTEVVGFEGDDLINTFVKNHPDDQCIIYSGDRDLHQLINKNVSVSSIRYSSTGDRKTTITKLKDLDGNSNGKYILFEKMLVGDKSDNLNGLPNVGIKTAPKIMEYGLTADEVLSNPETPQKIKNKILDNYAELEALKSIIELKELVVDIEIATIDNIMSIFKEEA